MTSAAVMQPTYLPWLGYLDLMDQVDTFVLLDTVPFAYQSWQHRNRLPGTDEPTWLTVPVTKASRRGAIAEVEVSDGGGWFPDRHVNILADRYRQIPEPHLADEVAELIVAGATGRLVDLTVPLLAWLADRFAIAPRVVAASQLGCPGQRTELVAALTRAVGADRYVSPPGSLEYLATDHGAFDDLGIEVLVHRYDHPTYDQGVEPFQSHCSALDLVLRSPATAAEVLRSGRREPATLADALLAPASTP
jgi:hypothetical protein